MCTAYLFIAGFIFFLANEATSQITCYACSLQRDPTLPPNSTVRLCSKFDSSAKFQVDCPYSTFCMKKTYEISIQGGRKVYGTIRDCAPQKYTYQKYMKDHWGVQHEVRDSIYQAGCQESNPRSELKASSAEYCYCQYNLCNAATKSSQTSLLVLVATCTIYMLFS